MEKKVELLEKKLVEQKVEALEEQLKLKDETINAYQKAGNVTNNNFKNNTFNTNNISINMFLNETCKNAPNLTDFVNDCKDHNIPLCVKVGDSLSIFNQLLIISEKLSSKK